MKGVQVHSAFVHKQSTGSGKSKGGSGKGVGAKDEHMVQGFVRLGKAHAAMVLRASGKQDVVLKFAGPRAGHPISTALIDLKEIDNISSARILADKLGPISRGILPLNDQWTKFAVRVMHEDQVKAQLQLYPDSGPAGLNFTVKETYVIDNIPIGSSAREVLEKVDGMIGWKAIKIKELKGRDGDGQFGQQHYSLLVGSQGPPSQTVIHMMRGRPILINPDRQSQLQQSWTKETTKEKFAAYFSEVSDSNSTSSSISSVSGTGSGEEGDGFGNELTLEEGLQSGGDASMGRARNWGTLAGAAVQGCVAIPATSTLPVPVSPPSSKGSGPDGPRPLKPSAKTGLEKLVEDLAVKVETLGERLATTRNELQGQIEQQCLRTQAQIEQQGKQTDERFERIFGLFSVQIAAFAKGRAPPSSTLEPGDTVEVVTDDSSGGVHGSQYGPAVVARKKVQFGPYVEDDDEK